MRIVVGWVGAIALVGATIVGGIAIANATVFSASAFVDDYLDALALGHVDEVLALPGVSVASGADRTLLDPDALGETTFAVVGDTEIGGTHRVDVADASGDISTTFVIERVGTRFGFFPEWGFARSPVSPLTVEATGDRRVTVGEVWIDLPSSGSATFAVLSPASYRLAHTSTFLTADPVDAVALGGELTARIDVVPSDAFETAAQEGLEANLSSCVSQEVLFPTGCPFGYAIENRVVSPPLWTISEMPAARLAPSDQLGVWAIPATTGVAHLSVEVQSLFDGSVSTLEKDVEFEASYLVAFDDATVVLEPTP
ncbi:hypothetical protein [Homoserinibacter sp. GY 40078]|uniref:hypothetical protein n=1 Tax=Homoserinibacter sp. GY 40078 TaxID=2603275 RepID=UPI0011C9D825|nr:hypothetical protein [Homoserinibacter sp. GY 40078]TXK18956.1 hypothetical protein FVQ89_03200 [Homoserinibacter sp. GY 40078]